MTRLLPPHARLPHGLRLSSGAERTKGRGSWASLRGDTEAFTTTWTYDIRGQLDVVEHPNTTEEEHLYDRAGRLSRHTDESGLVSTWAYDGLGRLESERLPGMASARTVTYAHGLSPALADAGGDGLEEHTLTEPDGGVWTTLYDFAGRPVWQDFPDATAEQRLYEGPRLHRTVYWDCAGSTCSEEAAEERLYDGLGRLHEVWGPSAPILPGFGEALTRTTWSDAGRRLRIEDGLGQGTDFDWEDGLLVEEHVEGVYRKTFVTEGLAPWLREEHTDAVSGSVTPRLTTYTRDALGRVTLQETARGTDVLTAAFDNFDPYGTPRYLASFDNGSEVVREERTIDSRGRISTATRSVEESLYGTAIYGWTGNGRLHHLEHEWADSTGRAVSYTRDSEGQVMSVSEGTSVLAEVDDRDAMGRMTELTLLDGVVTTLSWDQRGRPTGLTVDVPGVGVQARSYAWDARGRLEERIIDSAGTVYGYAEPGWLTDETGPSGTFTYEYDAAGNRVSTDDGTTVTDFDYATGNRLVAVDSDALTWDGLGGVVEDQRGYEFERLPDGRAWGVRAPGGAMVQEVLRDAEGLPVRHYPASPGLSSTRIPGNPMGAWPLAGDDGGERRMWVGLDGLLVARLEGASVRVAAMSDPLTGTLVLLDDELLDGASAWGTQVDAPVGRTESFVFAGMETLPGAPHKLAGHRLYDPETGRFLSADPLGLDGGPHRFGYAEGEPTRLVDPVGLSAVGVMSTGVWDNPVGGSCTPGRCWNAGGGKTERSDKSDNDVLKGNDEEFEKLGEDMAGADESNRPDMTSSNEASDGTQGTATTGGGGSVSNEFGGNGLNAAREWAAGIEKLTSIDEFQEWKATARAQRGSTLEGGTLTGNAVPSRRTIRETIRDTSRFLKDDYGIKARSPNRIGILRVRDRWTEADIARRLMDRGVSKNEAEANAKAARGGSWVTVTGDDYWGRPRRPIVVATRSNRDPRTAAIHEAFHAFMKPMKGELGKSRLFQEGVADIYTRAMGLYQDTGPSYPESVRRIEWLLSAVGSDACAEAVFRSRDTTALEKAIADAHPAGSALIREILEHSRTMIQNSNNGVHPETGIPSQLELQKP